MVLDIDEDRRRISLGLKQCKSNPWDEFAQNHRKGERVQGQIKSTTDFGIFIGLDGGIDGLVHLSDISWNEPGESAVRRYSKGEEIETVIFKVDGEINTDDFSPASFAYTRADIPLHSTCMGGSLFPNGPQEIADLKAKTNLPVTFVGDVVGTGSSRKSARRSR